jgi:hypothetical protein
LAISLSYITPQRPTQVELCGVFFPEAAHAPMRVPGHSGTSGSPTPVNNCIGTQDMTGNAAPLQRPRNLLRASDRAVTRACLPSPTPRLAHADMLTLPKTDTNCTALSLMPAITGHTFAASLRTDICPQRKESSSTSHARNPFNLNFFDSAQCLMVRRWRLIG